MFQLLSACLAGLTLASPASAYVNNLQDQQGQHGEGAGNHLVDETSPYLLQHAYNPVDWYPWGPEAIALAKKEDKPIFLSVGYSACHWCHVMERESFENEEIAALMNRWFICVKVDREERPDIDAIYMAAVQRMTGRGGWPMSVFMTPDLEPYITGTYYPPKSAFGRPGFDDVLTQAHTAWVSQREAVVAQGQRMMTELRARSSMNGAGKVPGRELLTNAMMRSGQNYDAMHGGFGRPPGYAPKFPHATELTYLLRVGEAEGNSQALAMVTKSLDEMAHGGIYDQIGGGFARYSVDREWTAPHFEKMLYDNSQLAVVYMEAWQATGNAFYRQISQEILDYVLKEMTSPEGGFYSTTDADSEGEEGKFFVWSVKEVAEICGDDAKLAKLWYGVSRAGNFEGHNILTARTTVEDVAKRSGQGVEEVEAAIARCRVKLYDAREKRIHPLLDDKVLSSWNGLMLRAFAKAAVVFEEPRYLKAAQRNADFLLRIMRKEDGSLYRTRRGTKSHLEAYLEDYAFVTQALIDLYEADLDLRWLDAAFAMQDYTDEHFRDPNMSYYTTADNTEKLPVRFNDPQESSLPSDIGVSLLNGARLGLLEGDLQRLAEVRAGLASHSQSLTRYPIAYCQLLILIDFLSSEPAEVYVVGQRDDPIVQARLMALQQQWPPSRVFALVEPGNEEATAVLLPSIEGKTMQGGQPTAYLCHEGVCEAPEVLK
ncbi:MAG: hypothetical protein ACI8X5_000235 [Planctomycetota bacterium]|jgi:uncharacterized protein YyaL (SSP411 family)